MKIFKNEVGRPSNEKLFVRRTFLITLVVVCITLIISLGAVLNINLNFIRLSGAATSQCKFPYTYTNCKGEKNNTIKEIQTKLKSIGYYSKGIDGKYNSYTKDAIKKYQKAMKLTQNGNLDYNTFVSLAKKTKSRYFIIQYNLNGSKTNLNGAQKVGSTYNQVFLYNVQEKISDTKLKITGYNHVGYSAQSNYNGKTYKFGCFSTNCTNGKWYDTDTINENAKKGVYFHSWMYDVGIKVSQTGSKGTGQVIKFTAQFCKANEKFDKSKSKCVPNSTTKKLKTFKLSCPTSVNVNKAFKCTTDIKGVKISATSANLAKGYDAVFTTTSSDFAKDLKYTKAQTVKVTATKSGYSTKTLTVKIGNTAVKTTKKAATITSTSKYSWPIRTSKPSILSEDPEAWPYNTGNDFTSIPPGECPWYAKLRAIEILKELSNKGQISSDQYTTLSSRVANMANANGKEFYPNGNISNSSSFKGGTNLKELKAGAFLGMYEAAAPGNFGHVVIVEYVDHKNKIIKTTETWRSGSKIEFRYRVHEGGKYDDIVINRTYQSKKYKINGYLYFLPY